MNDENLTPWKKGQSGNPGGIPKGYVHTATRLRRWLDLEVEEINPATGKKEKATILERMDAAQIKKAIKGDIAAYREILDRLEGKALQKNEVSGDVNLHFDKDDEKV